MKHFFEEGEDCGKWLKHFFRRGGGLGKWFDRFFEEGEDCGKWLKHFLGRVEVYKKWFYSVGWGAAAPQGCQTSPRVPDTFVGGGAPTTR